MLTLIDGQPTAGGVADFALAVPATPVLVGATVSFQAAKVGTLRRGLAIELATGLEVRILE